MKSTPWSVGEVARRLGVATHVLRHWEDEGLIAPARDSADRRRYGPADLTRLAVIMSSKAAGMSLVQIRVLLDAEAHDRHRILSDHLTDLDRRMTEMERSRHLTVHALGCRAHDVAACPTFAAHVQDIVDGKVTGLAFGPEQLVGPG
ncbi:MAG: MerR family transcriptional regulator [Actinobacteria bacterium]|uniref:Unannotated protein n=1 Tax=freshwater metagenome TaxID=449393 RepID=A0A6J6R422_9ZZZZ|nr:MerR family transcriptional regulator [Actinomycetota bacterium]